jgi:hypothetical protein
MTDLPSSLGIEAVECLSEGGRSVTVRVTGRWRRRRPELRGQPMLVVEAETGRRRFLAMPEPPSLTGAAPGTWRMSFSVPATLAPALPGRTFLQLGGVTVPLPIGEITIADEAVEGSGSDVVEARRARSSELAADSARRRVAELTAKVERLERELDEARAQSERLRAEISDRERWLRVSEQHTHAERALRGEVEEESNRRARAAAHDLRVLQERVAELEREAHRMRRAVDEAEHLAAAAQIARAGAERRLDGRAPPSPAPNHARGELSRRELELASRVPVPVAPPRPVDRLGDRVALRHEAAMAECRVAQRGAAAGRLAALERELANAREEVEAQRRRSARAYEAIELVRAELRQLRATSSTAPLQVTAPSEVPPAPGSLQVERLSAALVRLRERTPVAETEEPPGASAPEPLGPEPLGPEPSRQARPVKPWLAGVFRALADQDPSAAGRLLLALLPAQRAADPDPVAYDLILADVVCAHVTVGSTTAEVVMGVTARPLRAVAFQLEGDLADIARLLAAGRVRRRLGPLLHVLPRHRLARVRGDRRRLTALDRLLGARRTLRDLRDAGVRIDPELGLAVAALMIDPAWTAGERFTIAHRHPSAPAPTGHLQVRDGLPPLAWSDPPLGTAETVLVCPGDELLDALAGVAGAGVRVEGEQRPLALIRQWLDRAQCG